MTQGGRPARITTDDVLAAGRRLGMARLTLAAVAAELEVSTTALYRHVDGRWGLERLVGESILGDLTLRDDPEHDTLAHLIDFSQQLRRFVVAHPGLAGYLQTLFPRGESGERLQADEIESLVRRGYAPDAAAVLTGSVASLSISLGVAQEAMERSLSDPVLSAEHQRVADRMTTSPEWAPAFGDLPEIAPEAFVDMLLAASIRGLVASAPPGAPVLEVITDLTRLANGSSSTSALASSVGGL